jgi:hypothetical protein
VLLPAPNRYTRTADPVRSVVGLASGADATYDLGHRHGFDLEWTSLDGLTAAAVERAGMLRGVVGYVDLTGVTYAVRVPEGGWSGLRAVPGTDPVRYDAALSLREDTPRMIPAPAPALPTAPPPGGGGGGATIDPEDGNVLLVGTGTIDPEDGNMLLWATA